MELKDFLTENEQKTRKWWLRLLLVGTAMSAVIFFWRMGSSKMPIPPGSTLPFLSRVIAFALALGFAYLYYALCYKRKTTFLLTVSLVGFWLGLVADAVFLFRGKLQLDLFLVYSVVFGSVSYLFTRKMRHLNKALKAYAKFPEEAQEAAASMRCATTVDEVQNSYAENIRKWPQLEWVLRRERKIKTNSLGA